MKDEFKERLVAHLKQAGAFDVRIADPKKGFEHAEEGRRPIELWQDCRSIVVFAVAMSTRTKFTYAGPYSPSRDDHTMRFHHSFDYGMDRLAHLFVGAITSWGAAFLQDNGYNVCLSASGIPGLLSRPTTQSKLCAYESGLGVYGRSGIIIHPELGNRMAIGTILTDAVVGLDPRLEDFHPCKDCDLCIRMCPSQAFDSTKTYPESWDRETCVSKKAETQARGYRCDACFACCPAGTVPEEKLFGFEEQESFYMTLQKERRNV